MYYLIYSSPEAWSIKKKFIPSLKVDGDTWLLYPYAFSLEAMQHLCALRQSINHWSTRESKTRGTIGLFLNITLIHVFSVI